MQINNRLAFGLPPDPWAKINVNTGDSRRIHLAVKAAVDTSAMLAVVGPRGSGKTMTIWPALKNIVTDIIEPARLDRERLHIGDIQIAVIAALSNEMPRHSAERRSGQVRRLLARQAGAALIIDDAHLLHHQTLRALKRLRELGTRGSGRPTLPVLLVGQADPTVQVAEVGLRTQTLTLAGLSLKEAGEALQQVLPPASDKAVINAMAEAAAGRTWLDLHALLDQCLAVALAAGEDRITPETVTRVVGAAQDRAPESHRPSDVAVSAALQRQGRVRRRIA